MADSVWVIDAQPIVAFILREAHWQRVGSLIKASTRGEATVRLTAVNAGEVVLGTERALGALVGHRTLDVIQQWTEIVNVDLELAARAAWFKLRGEISYADCFAAALAHRDGLPLITGDPEFHRVEDVIRVVWLDTLAV